MARVAKRSKVQPVAEWKVQAMAAQAAFDASYLAGPCDAQEHSTQTEAEACPMCAQPLTYEGAMDEAHTLALQEDQDRVQGRYNRVVEHFTRQHADAKDRIDKWAARLAKYPASAFEWAGSAFEAAGRHEVAAVVLQWLETRGPVGLRARLQYEVATRASSTSSSTSQAHNLMERCRLAAYAKALEEVTCGWLGAAGLL